LADSGKEVSEIIEALQWIDKAGVVIRHRDSAQGSAEIASGAQQVVRDNRAASLPTVKD
jgi:hypothetical protein